MKKNFKFVSVLISLFIVFGCFVTTVSADEPQWDILYSEIVAKGSYHVYPAGTKIYYDILPQLYTPSDTYSKNVCLATYDYAVDSGLISGTKDVNYTNLFSIETIEIGNVFELKVEPEVTFGGSGNIMSGGYWVFMNYYNGNTEFFAVESSGTGDSITVDQQTEYITPSQFVYTNYTETKADDIYFTKEITDVSGLNDLFTNGGYGYLANDITLGNTFLTINGEANLFLNGKTIDLNKNYINVPKNATLNIFDNGITGIIRNGSHSSQGGAFNLTGANGEEGVLNMYGGTIRDCIGPKGGAVNIAGYGTFHMYGGLITKNSSDYGGGVFNNADMSFHMHGGTITDNYALYKGGGVWNSENISFDGLCVVDNNYAGQGNENRIENVYTSKKFKLYFDDQKALGLKEGSKVGVTYNTRTYTGQISNEYQNPNFNQAKQTDYFFVDNPNYYVAYNQGTGSGGYLEIKEVKVFIDKILLMEKSKSIIKELLKEKQSQ